ncbi:MAG: branched-chain amino acid transport system permease protein [Solirubrobacteraceae bacterium]
MRAVLEFLLGVGVLACLYGILSLSLNLQAGVSALMNFGLVAFFGIGAYATGIASEHGLNWAVAIVLGVALAALAGAAVGFLGRTLLADYWAIATLALAELVRLVALNQDNLTGGAQGISNVRFPLVHATGTWRELSWLGITAVVLAACYLASERLTRAQAGRALRLLREQPEVAASLGHNVVTLKARVLALGAAMAALAGSLYTHYISFVGPGELIAFETFIVWTMLVVGGLGSARGAIVGAFAVRLLYDLTRYLGDDVGLSADVVATLRIMLVGAALLGFLLLRPGGLAPERLRGVDA